MVFSEYSYLDAAQTAQVESFYPGATNNWRTNLGYAAATLLAWRVLLALAVVLVACSAARQRPGLRCRARGAAAKPKADPAPPGRRMSMGSTLGHAQPLPLLLQNVACYTGSRALLQPLSCAIDPGSLTAFLGPSGAGKTTAFTAIAAAPADKHLRFTVHTNKRRRR